MGQAWCKEKSAKAQDSKSPLDRVFLRCAHRIYPGLKEEGSVLGGATQRVTSSEIGYASSPPREVLTRGQSIDSVDRPFHPNDWVDVNLEVPGTPRASSMITNLTYDASLYPPTTHTSMNSRGSYLRDFTPVPPPRRRKKNRSRPLPPKPGDVSRSHVDRVTTKNCSKESRSSCHEPLYSFVKSHKTRTGEKELFKHKVNGTGRVIPSIVLAANRSNGEKSIRGEGHGNNARPKNSSTVSLPNYTELEASNDAALCEDEGELKVYKITAAESLPSLITSGALENVKKSDSKKKDDRTIETDNRDKNERRHSVDEVDFSFEGTQKEDILNSIMKLEEPMLTSTPVKNDVENDSRTLTSGGGWFLHHDRARKSDEPEDIPMKNTEREDDSRKSQFHDSTQSSQVDVFFEAEENLLEGDNRTSIERAVGVETEKRRMGTRASLKRTLSNESEPFDSYEEKELRESESTAAVLRLNSHVKLLGRSISKESLPREMFDDPDETDFFMDDKQSAAKENTIDNTTERKVAIEDSIKSDTETPRSIAEPKIKPQIFDNDHSTLLKILHDEAEESNLSSMTPSLTELEAALSDMLEREGVEEKSEIHEIVEIAVPTENNEADKSLEKLIEPEIVVEKNIKKSSLPVSLKNILGDSEASPKLISPEEKPVGRIKDNSMIEIDSKNGDKNSGDTEHELVEIAWNNSSRATILALQPPEKPSRLHQISLEDASENSGAIPTPPRRRNRSSASGHSTTVLRENVRRTSERTVTPEIPYPNDRLI